MTQRAFTLSLDSGTVKRRMPVMMSEMEAGTASLVWSVSAPFERMPSIIEIAIMAKAEAAMDAAELFYNIAADTAYIESEDFYETLYEI